METLAKYGVIKGVQSHWRELGAVLGQGDRLDGYMAKALMNFHTCCTYVFQAWIDNGGTENYPLTWQGFYDALSTGDVGCREIARNALNEMGIPFTP